MYNPLVQSNIQRSKEQEAALQNRKLQEDKYKTEVKLELVKLCGIQTAKKHFDLIKEVPFPDFSFHWRALEIIIKDVTQIPTTKSIEEIVEFLKSE